jgi:argonaute-like protein implicated in RNA metabolism and viral defense
MISLIGININFSLHKASDDYFEQTINCQTLFQHMNQETKKNPHFSSIYFHRYKKRVIWTILQEKLLYNVIKLCTTGENYEKNNSDTHTAVPPCSIV